VLTLVIITLGLTAATFYIILQIALALKGIQEKVATSPLTKLFRSL
jgi:hypothetical protein